MSLQLTRSRLFLFAALGMLISLSLFSQRGVLAQDNDAPANAQSDDAPSDNTDDELVVYPRADEADEDEEETPGNNSIEPKRVPLKEKEKLQRRAGEKTAGDAQGAAVVLGMHLQEAGNERVKVVEVASASAAFDAGIREGDLIVSFASFRGKNYRDWIDGMRRLSRDTPDGENVPVVVLRDNKQLTRQVRVPISRVIAKAPQDELVVNQEIVAGQAPQPIIPGQPAPVVAGGGDDIMIANAFGADFDNNTGPASERAIAEIFQLNTPAVNDPTANDPNQSGGQVGNSRARDQALQGAANQGAGAGGRIGLAGFRSDANGMFVIVDVGGLPAGNYLVGIDDPGVMSNTGGGGTAPGVPVNPRPGATSPGTNTVTPPTGGVENVPFGQPAGGRQPGAGQQPARGATPTQNQPQPSTSGQATIPRDVLAQVIEPAATGADTPGASSTDVPATGQNPTNQTPATGNTAPLDTPVTGQVRESGATPTGVPRVDPQRDVNDGVNSPIVNGGVAGPSLQIGMLTVDQNGTGRLQQVIESVRVQDVLGQAIVIYSQNAGQPGSQLNQNENPATGRDTNAIRPARGSQLGGANTQPGTNATNPTARVDGIGSEPTTANGVNAPNGNVPVAAGLVRPIGGPLPGGVGTDAAVDPRTPGVPQPNVPQNSGVPADAGQQRVR